MHELFMQFRETLLQIAVPNKALYLLDVVGDISGNDAAVMFVLEFEVFCRCCLCGATTCDSE